MTTHYDKKVMEAYGAGQPIPFDSGCPTCGEDHPTGGACNPRVLRAIDAAHRDASLDPEESDYRRQ
jgi:hypothetical protein